MDIKKLIELLQKSLEAGLVTQEEFDEAKAHIESHKFTQEKLNEIIQGRLEDQKKGFASQLSEYSALKEKLGDQSLDDILSTVEELKSQLSKKEEELNTVNATLQEKINKENEQIIDGIIAKYVGDVKLPKPYLDMIARSTNEEEVKTSVESVLNQFKEDMKATGLTPQIGGGTSPAGGTGQIDISNPYSLLYQGFKEMNANK